MTGAAAKDFSSESPRLRAAVKDPTGRTNKFHASFTDISRVCSEKVMAWATLNVLMLMLFFYGPSVGGKYFATHGICNCDSVMSKDVSWISSLPPAPLNFNVDGFPWAMHVVAKIFSFQNLLGVTSSTSKFGGWGVSCGLCLSKCLSCIFFFVAKYFPSTVRRTSVFPLTYCSPLGVSLVVSLLARQSRPRRRRSRR